MPLDGSYMTFALGLVTLSPYGPGGGSWHSGHVTAVRAGWGVNAVMLPCVLICVSGRSAMRRRVLRSVYTVAWVVRVRDGYGVRYGLLVWERSSGFGTGPMVRAVGRFGPCVT